MPPRGSGSDLTNTTHDGHRTPSLDIMAQATAEILGDSDDDVFASGGEDADPDTGLYGGSAGLWQPDSPARVQEHVLDYIQSIAIESRVTRIPLEDTRDKCMRHGFTHDQFFHCIETCNKDGTLKIDEARTYIDFPYPCLLYTSPSPRDRQKSRMPSSA